MQGWYRGPLTNRQAFVQQLLGIQDNVVRDREIRKDTVPSLESSLSDWGLQLPWEIAMN